MHELGIVSPHNPARILFVGDDFPGSNATSLRNAVLRSGHECLTVPGLVASLPLSLRRKLCGQQSTYDAARRRWNSMLRKTVAGWRPDVLLVFKGVWVERSTVESCGGITVHYHPDDSTNPYNRTPVYDAAESAYDLHITTKSFNVSELRSRRAKDVLYLRCAFDRDWHRPVTLGRAPRFSVGFIGTRRPDRTAAVHAVARRWGRSFHVAGGFWKRDLPLRLRATVTSERAAFLLSLAVADAPVQLGFLNSDNRDLHTCRSYEVPAAGGLLIAERTAEHTEMLDEGREALFFSSTAELLDNLSWAVGHSALAHQMGMQAAARVRRDHSAYDDRWATICRRLELKATNA